MSSRAMIKRTKATTIGKSRKFHHGILLFFLSLMSFSATVCFSSRDAAAETDIRITGPTRQIPIAIPQLCDAGGGGAGAVKVAEVMTRDLQISGLFRIMNPASFVEAPGRCNEPDKANYADWSVINADALVRGDIRSSADGGVDVRVFLHDVPQQRSVVGKRYAASSTDLAGIAHKFANEIVKYFTGEPGIFGTRIAYVSRVGRFKELFVMDLDGSNVRQLTHDKGLAMSPSWSPNGNQLIYTSYRSRKPELYTISPEGGEPRQITERQGLEIGAKFMRDGQLIVTSAAIAGVSKIAILDTQGRLVKKLTSGDSIDVSPSLSPDGGRIAFCSNRAGGPQIYVMSSSGEPANRISFANSNYCTSPSWSPKGDKIAFICRAGGNQVFISNPDGSQTTQLTFGGDNEDPSWSPDGRFLAYSSNASGGARNITVMSLLNGAAGAPTRITFAKSEDSQPAWSPKID